MRLHHRMGQAMHIIKRLGVGAISSVTSLIAFGKVLVSSLGDIQAVSASAGTFAGVVLFLNSLPMWFVTSSFLLSTGYLVWSTVQDDRARWKAMRDYKAVNDKAWAFEPQFLARCEGLEALHEEASTQNALIASELIALRSELASVKQDLHDSILEAVKPAAMDRAQVVAAGAVQHLDGRLGLAEQKLQSSLGERMRIIDKHHADLMHRFTLLEEQIRQSPQGTYSEPQP